MPYRLAECCQPRSALADQQALGMPVAETSAHVRAPMVRHALRWSRSPAGIHTGPGITAAALIAGRGWQRMLWAIRKAH